MSRRGHKAALPMAPHHRPAPRPHDGLKVEHRDKKGNVDTFEFEQLPVSAELQHAFARWFSEKCAPGGGWDSLKSSRAMWFYLLTFCRFCAEQESQPQRLEDLTPALWNRWRMRRPEGIYGYHQVTSLGGFLRKRAELSEATRSAMAKRLPTVRTREQALAPDEFLEVCAAARKMFRSAHLRIQANTAHLHQWRAGAFEPQSRDWLIGEALDALTQTGYVPHIRRDNGWKRNLPQYVVDRQVIPQGLPSGNSPGCGPRL